MKPLKLLFAALALAASGALADPASFQQRAAPHPALYSFADVFRLTVSGPMAASAESAAEATIRVAAPPAHTQSASEARFVVKGARQPDQWMLLIAGLAFAGWVAHRRLTHSS
jgi:hypothetical protein